MQEVSKILIKNILFAFSSSSEAKFYGILLLNTCMKKIKISYCTF